MQSLKYLNQIATYLQVQPGTITLNSDLQPTRVDSSNSSITGFVNILGSFLIETSNSAALTPDDAAELYQWLEYAIVHAVHNDISHNMYQILGELNGVFESRTYFVSNRLTIADVLMYYILQNVMENLHYLDKEKFMNVSRWFDNLQQNAKIRQNNRMVDFSTLFLSGFVPARH